MASDHSMDIGVDFDFQELRNAVDQAKRDSTTRYDLKDSKIEIELSEDQIKVNAASHNQIEAVYGILLQKMIARSLSPKILKREDIKEVGGMRVVQEMKLVTALDQENAKKISKLIRDSFPKTKSVIQGDSVRVSAKSIDDLQAAMRMLNEDESLEVPLNYTNFK
ncbi:YajQ family cyclic di-GMP-binding protein [Candidatus Peregrinibacteria bacterium]|jgi:cyclic-di-GMP-binding protein|nr:YajQ family cyclic di-GMP-binding protein [Candidatus Peregrinibacteria bacterium]MBT7736463.1 YajQ family cyclic di-GMP-binding protein [Candidatus Peregrinibacteria bacterium]